jgi:L-rhamnose isomerase
MEKTINKAYEIAKKQYANIGIDTDKAIELMDKIEISLHCWQADDVRGFEVKDDKALSGGIQATGGYPGQATTIEELRADLDKAMSQIPGKQRLNLHAIYGDFGDEIVDRDKITVKHFQSWIDWAKERKMGLDFNATCFSHPMASSGFTLSSKNETIRKFWVDHVKCCREISAEMGKQLGKACVHNIWIPDGSKDTPIDRNGHRAQLKKSLDEIFSVEYSTDYLKDAIESKLFGIGVESMTVGSHDFYLSYAAQNNKLICLDNGHFHPTEQVGDKISACLQFLDEILLHVTRPIRWDSDHVVNLNEDIQLIASEIIRNNYIDRVNIGLDFFDASINRIGAYVTGTRAAQKAFLIAALEPTSKILEQEEKENYFGRMAMLEELKTMPFGAVWDYYCQSKSVSTGFDYIEDINHYESEVLLNR